MRTASVGELDVQRLGVGRRVDRDGFDAELVERADDADGDLATVRYEDTREHGESLRSGHADQHGAAFETHPEVSPPGCS